MQSTSENEARARRLHRESLVFIGHDHNILADDIEQMRLGGVTAKELHISLDGQLFGPRDVYLSSAPRAAVERELGRRRAEGALSGDHEELLANAAKSADTSGFLRRAMVAMDYVHHLVDSSGGAIRIAYEPTDVVRAKEEGAIALLLGTEGARLLEGRLEVLRMLARLGLRQVGLIWAFDTEIGAAQGDRTGRGLSPFGRAVVREMNRLGLIIDAAHLSQQSIRDVLQVSSSPITVSHSGAAALNQESSNLLPDSLLDAVAENGGLVSVHFMSQMVKPGRAQARPEHLAAQFCYLVERLGAEHVGCGPDYLPMHPRAWENQGISSPFSYVPGVETIAQFENVTRLLVAAGLDDRQIGQIIGGSHLRLFEDVRRLREHAPEPYRPFATDFGACTEGTTPL